MDNPPRNLLDQVRDICRLKHLARSTDSYVSWIKRYILFHGKRHPKDLRAADIASFLTHFAVDLDVSASTQNQAFSALVFLYREVLQQDLEPVLISTAKRPERFPTVLTLDEARCLIGQLSGPYKLMAQLLYGSGLRLMECVRLRLKDVDLDYLAVTVCDGKGEKDRVTPLPRVNLSGNTSSPPPNAPSIRAAAAPIVIISTIRPCSVP
jgi:site-specific recombinase XerD